MDEKQFDEMYLDLKLSSVVSDIRRFRDLELPKIRGSLPRGYAHSPEEEFSGVICFLDKGIIRGLTCFRDIRNMEDGDYNYGTIRSAIMRLYDRWRYRA